MDPGQTDSAPGIRSGEKRRWFSWNKAQKNAEECVWTSDEDDVNSAPGKSNEIGKAWAPNGKRKGTSGKWNRSQKRTIECDRDRDAVSDIPECRFPVEIPGAKRKIRWESAPKSTHECVHRSDADKLREMEKAVGVSGHERERMRRRRRWNKPQKDAAESAWDSDTILDD